MADVTALRRPVERANEIQARALVLAMAGVVMAARRRHPKYRTEQHCGVCRALRALEELLR
jgi:hypothetical protein